MKYFIQQAIIGQGVSARAGLVARVLERPDHSTQAIARYTDPSKEFGVATGNAVVGNDGRTYWQITMYSGWVKDPSTGKYRFVGQGETNYRRQAWVYANVDFAKQKVDFKDDMDSDQVIHAIIQNDNNTVTGLNHAAALISLQERAGIDVSRHKKKHQEIYERVQRRRRNMARQGIKFNEKEPSSWQKFKDFFGFSGLGEPITITVCLVLVLIAAVAGGALFYWVFWPDYEDSQYDIQETAEIVAILEKVSPQDRATLEAYYNAEANKAYQTGKAEGSWGQLWNVAKYGAFAVGGFYIINKITEGKK